MIALDVINKTIVTEFIFVGLTNSIILACLLYIFFLLVYLVTIVGNIGMMAVVFNNSHLQKPMYYFLANLSLVDLLYFTAVTPKMLSDLVSKNKSISVIGCALQYFFFLALAVTEVLLLTAMSYDRYIAICHPLHYVSIITQNKCALLIFLAYFIVFFQSSIQTNYLFMLQFCDSNLIDHFYCDFPPLVKLSCSETFYCQIVAILCTSIFGVGSLLTVLVSYSFIVLSIFKMKSSKGRSRAFSTCSSHFTSVSIFYGTVFFMYLRPPRESGKQDKVVSVFYTVVIPMLNHLIYSLRNREVTNAIKEDLQKIATLIIIMYI